MNTDLLAHIIYLLLTYLITVHVGWRFYTHGRVYILALLHQNEALTDAVNRLLLVGYYLLNLGYAALMIKLWQRVDTLSAMMGMLAQKVGTIMLTLACIHFCNMAVIAWLHKKQVSEPIK
jgi:hypothetical protein